MIDPVIVNNLLLGLQFALAIGSLVVAIATISRYLKVRSSGIADKIMWRGFSLQDSLQVLLEVAYDDLRFPDTADVRMAIYVPHGSRTLIQATDYIPGRAYGSSRRLPLVKGIVGRAYQSGRVYLELLRSKDFERPGFFAEYLERKWGFTPSEAKSVRHDRRGYFAIPITGDDGVVLAVWYADTADASAFARPDLVERTTPFVQLLEMTLAHKPKRGIRRPDNAPHSRVRERSLEAANYVARGWQAEAIDDDAQLLSKSAG